MNTQEIKSISNAVARADQSCAELILRPETAGEFAHNAEIVSGLREQVAAITAMIRSMSTGVDIAPLPDPPSEIYLPPTAAEFIALVRAGKVQVETPSGDTTNALIDRASVGWARIGWDYELGDDNEWVAYHDSTAIDSLTTLQQDGNKVFANGVTFTIDPL
jgi:hypothetical protein